MVEARVLSKAEMILLAAYEKWPDGEFSSENLVVASWKKYPDSFGLQGYTRQYPDSNVVYRYIMGKDSIVKKQRWLSQTGRKLYVITPAGVSHVVKIQDSTAADTDAQKRRIDRFRERVLLRIVSGPAWQKLIEDRLHELTFTDACSFWSINPRSSGEQYTDARRAVADAIATIRRHLEEGSRTVVLATKIELSLEDTEKIEALGDDLTRKFSDQLNLIRQRRTRWGKTSIPDTTSTNDH